MREAKLVIVAMTDPAGMPITDERPSPRAVRASLFRMLRNNVLCSMATVTPEHRAHVNTAYFSYSDELELYFLSHPASRHCQNLEVNPSMAMTVFSSSQRWGGPDRGLQLFGTCKRASGATAIKAADSYTRRFAAFADWQESLSENDPGKSYAFYRFVVARVNVFDEQAWGKPVFVLASISR